ncbi:hypothetical protein PROFUN_09332 [Planoprotostelium fungivorum]|uniref:Uncharacterized protein n=1 Tax=Planoprotostelium fungivorum TaxID=1890364 RepID=A0A2P6NHD2_9EUKA|nr:hypothetical protein PROFUN_09332 [Planoprotostelium fungivorum]
MIGKTIVIVALLSLAAAKILSFPSEYRTHISDVEIDQSPSKEESDLEFRGNVSTYIREFYGLPYYPDDVRGEVKRFDFNTLWFYQINKYVDGTSACTRSKFEAGRQLDEYENPISWTVNNGANTLKPCFYGDKIGRKVKCERIDYANEMCVTLDGALPLYSGDPSSVVSYRIYTNWTVGVELKWLPPLLNINDADCKTVRR